MRSTANSIAKVLALSLAGLLLYPPAMLLPLMTFEAFGFSNSANILESVLNFYRNEYYFVSVMVLLSAVVFPFILLITAFIVSLHIQLKKHSPLLKPFFKLHLHLEEWAMVEVYLLGILVTIIKMSDSSAINYQGGVLCFACLVIITLAIGSNVDRHLFWRFIENRKKRKPLLPIKNLPEHTTAAAQNLLLCHLCFKLVPNDNHTSHCPRCDSVLHQRKPQSISRTLALVITSIILIAPANLLPMMEVDKFGIPDKSTIIDGIIYFMQNGSFFIGLIILCASIFVPVFKIIGLSILLFATRPGKDLFLVEKTVLYRFITFIGRWSMLDIFVISLLSVLVNYGIISSIHTAPAATYFTCVVTTTMFAAITFDPRLLWDNVNINNEQQESSEYHP
jgi:paraquat-inducible protein A